MADTCARCHRPPGTALGECFRAALERDGDPAADDAYTATGADCAEATIARLQAELAEAYAEMSKQIPHLNVVFDRAVWARARAAAEAAVGVET